MGILSRIQQEKAKFRAKGLQRDAQKLEALERERTYQQLRAGQRAQIAEEKRLLKEAKGPSKLDAIKGKLAASYQKGRGVDALKRKDLKGIARQQATPRPSLFAQNNYSSGYRGLDLGSDKPKKKGGYDPFGYRGLN